MARDAAGVTQEFEAEEDNMLPGRFHPIFRSGMLANCFFATDEADAHALNEFISEEEAMQMAMQETMRSNDQQCQSQRARPNASFSDDEYDDIFMTISDPAQSSQDMDMS